MESGDAFEAGAQVSADGATAGRRGEAKPAELTHADSQTAAHEGIGGRGAHSLHLPRHNPLCLYLSHRCRQQKEHRYEG